MEQLENELTGPFENGDTRKNETKSAMIDLRGFERPTDKVELGVTRICRQRTTSWEIATKGATLNAIVKRSKIVCYLVHDHNPSSNGDSWVQLNL